MGRASQLWALGLSVIHPESPGSNTDHTLKARIKFQIPDEGISCQGGISYLIPMYPLPKIGERQDEPKAGSKASHRPRVDKDSLNETQRARTTEENSD